MTDEVDKKAQQAREEERQSLQRMYWHSRRGMLELDLLLVPFAQEKLATLAGREQALYRELLKEEDQDLFSWLIDRSKAPTPEHREIVEQILRHKSSSRPDR